MRTKFYYRPSAASAYRMHRAQVDRVTAWHMVLRDHAVSPATRLSAAIVLIGTRTTDKNGALIIAPKR